MSSSCRVPRSSIRSLGNNEPNLVPVAILFEYAAIFAVETSDQVCETTGQRAATLVPLHNLARRPQLHDDIAHEVVAAHDTGSPWRVGQKPTKVVEDAILLARCDHRVSLA